MKRTFSQWAILAAVGAASVGCSSDDSDSTTTTGADTSGGSDTSGGGDTSGGSDTAGGGDATDGTELGTIPEVAAAAGDFTALLAAATKAGLVETLSGEGPITVFAPNDAAFTKAGIDLETFDTPEEIATLSGILTYHAALGKVLSTDLSDGQMITTLNGAKLSVSIADGVVKVGDATVTSADIDASNGVIHVIDTVLMPPAPTLGTIPEVATAAGDFTALLAAATKAGLVDALSGEGPITVFAPNDAAFTKAGIDLATFDTPEEIATLTGILTYHATLGAAFAKDLSDGQMIKTLNGAELPVSIMGGVVKVGGATVIAADIEASNGVIHVIDTVLMPPAPALGTIPEVAAAAGDFTALLAAATKAGLVDALSGEGPITVFAPNDAAFTKAGIDLATFDTPEEIATLTGILTYHATLGAAMAKDLSDGQMIKTLNGAELEVSIMGGVVKIGGATVIAADIKASNGVIHVIDTVLMPPAPALGTIPEVATAAGSFTSLLAAVTAAGLADDLSAEGPFTVFAPNDAAFTKAGIDLATYDTPEELTALANILLTHVVGAEAPASSLSDGQEITTLSTAKLTVSIAGGVVKVGGATVIATDIPASNGLIHVIDTVILP